jgi:predicted site-specific integrase-resolvase
MSYQGLAPLPAAVPPRRARSAQPTKAEQTQQRIAETRAALSERTERGARAIEKAILVLYARQTSDEQTAEETKHSNGVGFTGADARFLTSLGKWINSSRRQPGQRLTERQRERARRQLMKYAAQLVRAADERAVAS